MPQPVARTAAGGEPPGLGDAGGAAPRSAPGARRRLASTFGVQTVAILLRIAQQVVLVPVLIRFWGAELYGDWLLVFAAAGFLPILDLGMQIYFGNAMLIAWARGEAAGYRRLLAVALGLYAAVLLSAAAILIGATTLVSWPDWLGTRVMRPDSVLLAAATLAAASLILIPFGVVTAVYRAHGDYSRAGVMSITAEALRGFGIIAVAAAGGTPVLAAAVYLAIAVVFWVGVLLDQRRRYGEAPPAIAMPRPGELRQAVVGAALYFIPNLATPIVSNAPILLLGTLGGLPGAVVAFSVVRTFTGFARQVVQQFCHAIGAELSRQQAIGDHARLRRLFAGAGRMVSGAGGLLGGLTTVVAEPFLRLWTHGAVAYDPWLVGIFVATILATAPGQVARLMFEYNNRPAVLAAAQGCLAAATILFCAVMIGRFAAAGAALAAGLAEFLGVGLLLPWAATRQIGLPLTRYFLHCWAVAGAGFGVGYGCAWAADRLLAARGLVGLAELGALWAGCVALPAFFLLLGAAERTWLRESAMARLSRIRQR